VWRNWGETAHAACGGCSKPFRVAATWRMASELANADRALVATGSALALGNEIERRRWRMKREFVGAAVGDRQVVFRLRRRCREPQTGRTKQE